MPTAQFAEPLTKLQPAKPQAKLRKSRRAAKAPPIDLTKETLSVPEAARLLDQEEWILRMLCRKGDIPSQEINGELHIALPDFFAYRLRRRARFDYWDNSPALKALDAVYDKLGDELYCQGSTEINTRLPQ